MNNLIYQIALKNALEHNGIADAGSIMGLIMSPQYKDYFKDEEPNEMIVSIQNTVHKINNMDITTQQNEYNEDALIESKTSNNKKINDPFLHKLREAYNLYKIEKKPGTIIRNHPKDIKEQIANTLLHQIICFRHRHGIFLSDDDRYKIVRLAINKPNLPDRYHKLLYTKPGRPFTFYIRDPNTRDEHEISFSLVKTKNKHIIPNIPNMELPASQTYIGNVDIRLMIDNKDININNNFNDVETLVMKQGLFAIHILKLYGYTYIFCNENGIEKPFWYQSEIETETKSIMRAAIRIGSISTASLKNTYTPSQIEYLAAIRNRIFFYPHKTYEHEQIKVIEEHFGQEGIDNIFADTEQYASNELTEDDIESIAKISSLHEQEKNISLPYTQMTGSFSQYINSLKSILMDKDFGNYEEYRICLKLPNSLNCAYEHIYRIPEGEELKRIQDEDTGQIFDNRYNWLDFITDNIIPISTEDELMELLKECKHIPASVFNNLENAEPEWKRYDIEVAVNDYIDHHLHEFITEYKINDTNFDSMMWIDEIPEPIKEICGKYKFKIDNEKIAYNPTFIIYTSPLRFNTITLKKYNLYPDRFFYFKRGDSNIYYMNWTTGIEHSMSSGKFANQLHDKLNDIRNSDDAVDQKIGNYLYRNFYIPLNSKITNIPPSGINDYYITISCDPKDILKKSTGQGWTSCEELGKNFSSGCIDDIRVKNAIAYLTRENSDRWITRVMIRWCHKTGKTDTAIDIAVESDTYGSHIYGKILSQLTRYILTQKGYMNFNEDAPCITPYKYTGSAYSAIRSNSNGSKLKFTGNTPKTEPIFKLPDGVEMIETNKDKSDTAPALSAQDIKIAPDPFMIVLLSAGVSFITAILSRHIIRS